MAGLVAFQRKKPFQFLETSPEIIRLAIMMYVRFPLSLRQDENLLRESVVDIYHETVCAWWNRFSPVFATEIRKRRVQGPSFSLWK
jgi:putative transposase